jgi:hypothetical protein
LIFSDAQPVQFWLANCETYNEKEVDGIFSKCFCQPFNCDDEITIQFKATTGYTYSIFYKKEEGTALTANFLEVSTGIYQKTFTPEEIGICDEQILLLIADPSVGEQERFKDASTWTTVGGAWDYRDNNKLKFGTENGTRSASMGFDNFLPEGTIVSFYLTIDTNAIDGAVEVLVSLVDGADYKDTQTINITPASIGVQTLLITLEVPPLLDASALRIDVTDTGSTSVDIDFYFCVKSTTELSAPFPILLIDETAILAKSDCLDIKASHSETTLINYRNNRAFASLNSSVGTPDPEFNIRIPSVFFKERFPEESEVMELSNSTSVQLNAQVKAQRLLNIGPMPFYMHRKMKLVLKFQEVTIDGQEWTQEETYELAETRRTHPLSKAAVWLTEKDYIMRNVL